MPPSSLAFRDQIEPWSVVELHLYAKMLQPICLITLCHIYCQCRKEKDFVQKRSFVRAYRNTISLQSSETSIVNSKNVQIKKQIGIDYGIFSSAGSIPRNLRSTLRMALLVCSAKLNVRI